MGKLFQVAAMLLALTPSIAAAQQVTCDFQFDQDEFKGVQTKGLNGRFIQDNVHAALIVGPNTVDVFTVKMWCAGLTCANIEGVINVWAIGHLIVDRPDARYDTASGEITKKAVNWTMSGYVPGDPGTVEKVTWVCND